jgi:hypothetical protein
VEGIPLQFIKAVVPALALLACLVVRAETPSDDTNKVPYKFIEHDDAMYRIHKITGKVERMSISKAGVVVWTEVQQSNQPPTEQKRTDPNTQLVAKPNEVANAQIGEPKKPFKPDIEGENGEKLPEIIGDSDRKAALADIASYEKDLSANAVVISGERLTGQIFVRNKGARKIKKLEVTLLVPVNKDKPEEHHFLYSEGAGDMNPPQPANTGGDSLSFLVQKVDLLCPAGGVKGNCEVKVTYIKFYDK